MPGLDHSDVIAFMRVIDAPASDIAVRAAGFIETVRQSVTLVYAEIFHPCHVPAFWLGLSKF